MKKFETLYMGQYRNRWRAHAPLSLNSTNPQPFTLQEMRDLVGSDFGQVDADLVLDYAPGAGVEALRQALIKYLYPKLAVENVVTTAGGNEAIYASMHALLEEGDEVISFVPTFEPLIQSAKDIGCRLTLLELDEEKQWLPNLDHFEEAISETTKLVIINFPHNPTGALIDKNQFDRIVALCKKYDVWLFSDEVFRGLEHDPKDRLPTAAESYGKGISIGVLSKSHGIPALRIGWIASQSQTFLQRVLEVKRYLSICNGKLSEIMAIPIIENSEKIFAHHRELLLKNIALLEALKERFPSFDFNSPKGGCTVFATMDEPSLEFADRLIENQNLIVIPGLAFVSKREAFRLGFSYTDYEARLNGFISMLDGG